MKEKAYNHIKASTDAQKILIVLLEGDLPSKRSLQIKYDDKLNEASNIKKIESRNREFNKAYREIQHLELVDEEEGKQKGPGRKPIKVKVNWEKLAEFLWDPVVQGSSFRKKESFKKYMEKLALLLESNREFLFNLDSFSELYKIGDKYNFPSISGVINTSICYLNLINACVLFKRNSNVKLLRQILYEMKTGSSSSFDNNIRFLVRKVWKEMNNLNDDEFEKRELKFLEKQIKKYKENFDVSEKNALFNKFYFYIHHAQGYVSQNESIIFDMLPGPEEREKVIELMKEGRPGVHKGQKHSTLTQGIPVPITESDAQQIQDWEKPIAIMDRENPELKEITRNRDYSRVELWQNKAIIRKKVKKGTRTIYKSPFELETYDAWLTTKRMFE